MLAAQRREPPGPTRNGGLADGVCSVCGGRRYLPSRMDSTTRGGLPCEGYLPRGEALHLSQRLLYVFRDVLGVLDTDGDPHQALGDPEALAA